MESAWIRQESDLSFKYEKARQDVGLFYALYTSKTFEVNYD